jgi:hypothetical protein
LRSAIVKLIAHRGWSEGSEENTLAAFAKAAADPRVAGVEFDVLAAPGGALMVAHDVPHRSEAPTLDATLRYLAGTDLDLLVEVKTAGIAPAVIEALARAGLADRSIVFAFADVARSFPWNEARPVRLGAILVYPWSMGRFVDRYRPDVILLGWDARPWTRFAFRAWWSVFSLKQVARRHATPIVAGIARQQADFDWLAAKGVNAATADMDHVGGAHAPDRTIVGRSRRIDS